MDRNIIKYILLVFFISFKVFAVEFDGKFIQGHFIIGKTDPNSKIKIDNKNKKYFDPVTDADIGIQKKIIN